MMINTMAEPSAELMRQLLRCLVDEERPAAGSENARRARIAQVGRPRYDIIDIIITARSVYWAGTACARRRMKERLPPRA